MNPWDDSRRSGRRKPVPFTSKLEILGITQEDFDFYQRTFVGSKYPYLRLGFNGWFEVHNRKEDPIPLDRNGIARHLLHEYAVAVRAGPVTTKIAFDLDRSTAGDLLERYNVIVSILSPLLPVVFRSSQYGGLHVYYFIERPMWTFKMTDFIRRRMAEHGYEIRSGYIEVLPTESMALRLPLGPEGQLLDPETLEPIANCIGDAMPWLRENIPARTYSIEDLLHGPPFLGNTDKHTLPRYTQPQYRNAATPYQRMDERAREILMRPIPEYGTRHDLTLRIIRYLWSQGYSRGETARRIEEWYEHFASRHCSKTLEETPKAALEEVERMIRSWYRKQKVRTRGKARDEVLRQPVSLKHVQDLLRSVSDHFPEEKLGIEPLRFLQWGFSFIQLVYYNGGKRVACSVKLLQQFPGGSSRHYTRRKKFWMEEGLFEEYRAPSRYFRRATVYLFKWDWSSGPEVATVEEGIRAILSEGRIGELFTRKIAERILDPSR